MILNEFDNSKEAVINPQDIVRKVEGCPKTIISCYAHNLIEYAAAKYDTEVITHLHSANASEPVYRIKGKDIGFYMAMVGAASTVAGFEELFAMGVEKILVFGTCGVLDKAIEDCSIIMPDMAVRDEGTSYHYVESSEEIEVNAAGLDVMRRFFDEAGVHYTVGKAWTTDGIYRETRSKVEKRKERGCICVDMECSAIAALAKFRGKTICQFFYSADNLDNDVWEVRSLSNTAEMEAKQKIVDLAVALGEVIHSEL